jgi:hypothetical protein
MSRDESSEKRKFYFSNLFETLYENDLFLFFPIKKLE